MRRVGWILKAIPQGYNIQISTVHATEHPHPLRAGGQQQTQI